MRKSSSESHLSIAPRPPDAEKALADSEQFCRSLLAENHALRRRITDLLNEKLHYHEQLRELRAELDAARRMK